MSKTKQSESWYTLSEIGTLQSLRDEENTEITFDSVEDAEKAIKKLPPEAQAKYVVCEHKTRANW